VANGQLYIALGIPAAIDAVIVAIFMAYINSTINGIGVTSAQLTAQPRSRGNRCSNNCW
jgi:hypothetical protein